MPEKSKPPSRADVLQWMRAEDRPVRYSDAVARFKGDKRAGQMLPQLARNGKIVRIGEGTYILPVADADIEERLHNLKGTRAVIDREIASLELQVAEMRLHPVPRRVGPMPLATAQAMADEARRRMESGEAFVVPATRSRS